MKTLEQFAAEETDNIRSGLIHFLEVVAPNQLEDSRRVVVRKVGGKSVYKSRPTCDEGAVLRSIDRTRAELDNLPDTVRRHYLNECREKKAGRVSLV